MAWLRTSFQVTPGGAYALASLVPASSYVQIVLTSEQISASAQWTEASVDGNLAAFAETTGAFSLASGILRLFKDDGPFGGEESAGAVACVALYEGALTPEEVIQQAADPARCTPLPPPQPPMPPVPAPTPSPMPAPAPAPLFRTGTYVGRTSQGLPISFTVVDASVHNVYFRWRARCADGKIHTKGMTLGEASISRRRFSVGSVLRTGGRAQVSGGLRQDTARGTVSRWGRTASGTVCRVRNVTWRAHAVQDRAP
jgi:hypothetical protein